jgi:short-chain Z-isoprenyl diphosphate synthase
LCFRRLEDCRLSALPGAATSTVQARPKRTGAWRQVKERFRDLAWHFVYRIYERKLAGQVMAAPKPRHVGIILDGNRRHARANGLNADETYRQGAAKLDEILAWSAELGIPLVTLWVFSPDNLTRPEAEIGSIFGALEAKMRQMVDDPHIHSGGVRVTAIGRRETLPASLCAAISAAEAATRENAQLTVTLAVGYGGREEITDAVRAMILASAANGLSAAEVAAAVTPDAIRRHLYVADMPDPDLIIRTSGEIRLSGFLLWQSVHSELFFCDLNWPAFRRIDYLRAIRSFQLRDRRFGG